MFNLSQHQGLFQWVSSLHQVAKVLELQLQHQSFQCIFRTDFLYDGLVWSLCSPRDSEESSLAPQFKSINSSPLSFLYGPALTSSMTTGKPIAWLWSNYDMQTYIDHTHKHTLNPCWKSMYFIGCLRLVNKCWNLDHQGLSYSSFLMSLTWATQKRTETCSSEKEIVHSQKTLTTLETNTHWGDGGYISYCWNFLLKALMPSNKK